MRRDTTGGNGGSNGAPNKVTPRKKKNAAGVISEVGQCREDMGRPGTAPPKVSPCSNGGKSTSGGDARIAPEVHPVDREERLPRGVPKKAGKARGPTLENALDDVQIKIFLQLACSKLPRKLMTCRHEFSKQNKLAVRFVLNLPEAELSSADRLFLQLEQAWWFYEDFVADKHTHLPHYGLKEFAKLMFEHCEALRPLAGKYNELFEYFRSWKGTIPTAGCILLNADMTKLVLVKSWRGNSRGLPRGKINQGEPAICAAVREVWEETGYDASKLATEEDVLALYLNSHQTTMFIVPGVDEDFSFEPKVRKEVSAVEWFPLDALPKGTYEVEPFMPRLKRWMAKARGMPAPKEATAEARTCSTIRLRKPRASSPDGRLAALALGALGQSETLGKGSPDCTPKKQGRKGKGTGGKDEGFAKAQGYRASSAPNRRMRGCDAHNRDTFGGGLEEGAGDTGWSFEAMLEANQRITGRTFEYDGNQQDFGDPALAGAPVSMPNARAAQPLAPTQCRQEEMGKLTHRPGAVEGRHAGKKYQGDRSGTRSAGQSAPGSTTADMRSGACDAAKAMETGLGAAALRADSARCPMAAGPCTDLINADRGRVGGGECSPSNWARATAVSAPTGGGHLFGEFKFDLTDIRTATELMMQSKDRRCARGGAWGCAMVAEESLPLKPYCEPSTPSTPS